MKNLLLLCLLMVVLLSGCSGLKQPAYQSEHLRLQQIDKGLFIHTSYLETRDFGKVACNGLIYIHGKEAIVYDTPTREDAARELIAWVGKKAGSKIIAVIPTHFHLDCLGSLQVFHEENIPSFASFKTISLSKRLTAVVPQSGFEDQLELTVGGEQAVTRCFGEGHTVDNVVGYIPSQAALFGGCLIKALGAGKGNLEDANTKAWSGTVEKIKEAFPALQIVVPGHGDSGGPELLEYTMALFKER